MSTIRLMAFIGLAACLAAACSTGTSPEPTGGQVTVRQSPATETPATPSDETAGATPTPAPTGQDTQLRAAISAAQQWLAFVDQGQYAESWSATGSLFQANMQQERWVQTLTGARTPLGTVVSREVAGSELRASLPNAPPGQYAIVSFATNFQNKPDIIETVTMIDEGGQWKVVGYSANPRSALEQQQQQQQGQPTPTPAPTPTPPQI